MFHEIFKRIVSYVMPFRFDKSFDISTKQPAACHSSKMIVAFCRVSDKYYLSEDIRY